MEKLELKLSDPGKQGKAERVFAGFHLSEDVGEKIYKVCETYFSTKQSIDNCFQFFIRCMRRRWNRD